MLTTLEISCSFMLPCMLVYFDHSSNGRCGFRTAAQPATGLKRYVNIRLPCHRRGIKKYYSDRIRRAFESFRAKQQDSSHHTWNSLQLWTRQSFGITHLFHQSDGNLNSDSRLGSQDSLNPRSRLIMRRWSSFMRNK